MTALNETIVDGKFRLLDVVGSGGFGTVYRARQLQFERDVALKVLNVDDVGQDVIKRFEREAKILQSFKTKYIPAIYGFGLWENKPYMAIELVDGISLDTVLERHGPMSLDTLRPIVAAVAEALAYAHSHGVAHRDLSPANILLVNKQGMPAARLIDFGLACFTAPDLRNRQRLTEAGYAVGTLLYMSPEQCLAMPADGRSDIYALGCIIYRALIGEAPFTDSNPVLLLRNHVQEPLPRLPDDLPPGLQLVLNKATAKEQGERYQTAEEFLHDWLNLDDVRNVGRPKFKLNLGVLSFAIVAVTTIASFGIWRSHQQTQLAAPVQPIVAESASSLLSDAHTAYSQAKQLDIEQSMKKQFETEAGRQLDRVLAIDNRTHELLPRQRGQVLQELADIYWGSGDKTKSNRAFELAREEFKMQVESNITWLVPIYYAGTALAADPPQRQEAIDYMKTLLEHKPQYPPRVQVLLRIFISQLYAANSDRINAEKYLPDPKTVDREYADRWGEAKRLIENLRRH